MLKDFDSFNLFFTVATNFVFVIPYSSVVASKFPKLTSTSFFSTDPVYTGSLYTKPHHMAYEPQYQQMYRIEQVKEILRLFSSCAIVKLKRNKHKQGKPLQGCCQKSQYDNRHTIACQLVIFQ